MMGVRPYPQDRQWGRAQTWLLRTLSAIRSTTPLILNGYALVANVGISAVLGIVFWMIATRLYTQEQVGFAAALISLMMTLSFLAQMNMGALLTRFLPVAKGGARRLVLKTYLGAGAVAAALGFGVAMTAGYLAEPLLVIRDSPLAITAFVGATVAWTLFSLQDAALSGLRRSVLVPVKNVTYSTLKIVALVLLATAVLPVTGGIFLACVLPLIPLIIIFNMPIFSRTTLQAAPADDGLPDFQTVTRFIGWDFVGSLLLSGAYGIAPLMVTASAGVSATATYHLAWSIAYSIHLVGMAMSVSLLAEGGASPARLHRLIVDTLSHALILSIAAIIIIIAAAPLLMGMFGQAYADEGSALLRVLALACLPWTVTTVFCASARIRGDTRVVALVQFVTVATFIGASFLLVGHYGALGVALGWLMAHGAACVGVVVAVLRRDGPGSAIDWTMALAEATNEVFRSATRGQKTSVPPERMAALTRSAGPWRTQPDDVLSILKNGPAKDVTTILIDAGQTALPSRSAVLKYASGPRGTAALQRNAAALKMLQQDTRLNDHRALLPQLLHEHEMHDSFHTVETAVIGIDGRQLLSADNIDLTCVAQAAATVAEMHRQTARPGILDEAWAREWIDVPAAAVLCASGISRGNAQRAKAMWALCQDLRHVFIGREVQLGLGHGDLWPGNLFFSPREPDTSDIRLTGLIDWDAARPDALAGLDACHLGLTVRIIRTGNDLAQTVRDFLKTNGWTADEVAVFGPAGLSDQPDEADCKAMVLLTWLRHLATVADKSDPSRTSRLWLGWSVDRVLQTVARHPIGVRQ